MSIGRVFKLAILAIRTHPWLLFGTAFVLGGLPRGLLALLRANYVPQLEMVVQRLNADGTLPIALLVGAVAVGLASALLTIATQGILIRTAMSAIEGRPATLGDGIATALRRLLPLLGISILTSLGVGIGLVMLIVPGLMLVVLWYVAAPAAVLDETGVGDSLSRSADLTRGARWSVFALFVLVLIAGLVIGGASGGIGTTISRANGDTPVAVGAVVLVSAIGSTLSTLLATIVPTALYAELRDWKEGPASGALTEVFA